MPLQKIRFKPGVNREGTSLANEGGWFDGDKIRFRSGYPEKIGGWVANGFNTFLGVCRSLWNWITLTQYNLLGVGTNLKFYVEDGGTYNDITPLRLTTNNSTTFVSGYSLLDFSLTATQTTITIGSATDFCPQGGLVRVGEEQIRYTSISGNTLVGCERGVNGTTAAAHSVDNYVWSNTIIVTDLTTTDVAVNDFVTFTNATTALNQGFPMTASVSGDIVSWNFVLDYSPDAPVTVAQNTPLIFTGGTIPGGVTLGTTYYCVNVTLIPGNSYEFNVAADPNGVPLTLTGGSPSTTFYGNFNNNCVITPDILNQEYQVYATITNTKYAVAARQAVAGNVSTTNGGLPVFMASPQVSNGGSATDAAYQINTGAEIQTVGTGWGAGPWNAGSAADAWAHGWGTGFSSGITLQLRLWNQVNFGEQLLFGYRNGPMYYFTTGGGATPTYTRGNLVSSIVGSSEVPAQVNYFTVSDATRIVIAFGATSYSFDIPPSTFDPMLIRWSEQESYTNWLPTATNQAGSYRLSHGSQIVTALQTRQEILVWTDSAVYSMQYLGPPYIWGFNLLADNISVMSQNSVTTAAGITYWMGVDKFYAYTGRVETLPCSVRQYVFSDLNRDQSGQVFAGTNEGYNEVWWYYCSAGSTVVDKYVIFNHLDRVWYYGTLSRTAWLDSALRATPIAATYTGLTVYHENGNDDGSVNPAVAINSYIQSSQFDIDDGDRYSFVWRMVPDITFDGSTTPAPFKPSADFTLLPQQNPGSRYGPSQSPAVTTDDSYARQHTYTVQQFTGIVYTRVRGRVLSFTVASNTLGSQWQLGTPSIDIRKDGRR